MRNSLFNQTGLTITRAQTKVLKGFSGAILAFLIVFGVALATNKPLSQMTQTCTESLVGYGALTSGHASCTYDAHASIPVALILILAMGLLPFIVLTLSYLWKISFRKEFRESEMAGSVNYLEEDEREQFLVMKATRRAYMVLNFTLLLAWCGELFTGNPGAALVLLIVQCVGAVSFRRNLRQG